MAKCKIHDLELRKSVKEYCPICEGEFSAHSFNNMRTCPFMFKQTKNEEEIEVGRAYPLIKGSSAHFSAQGFNESLKTLKNLNILNSVFRNFISFEKYMKKIIGNTILKSCERELYSFYLFKKELYESFYADEIIENFIPIICEKWLSIPFSREQFDKVSNNEKGALSRWIKIGIHNILDEAFIDKDGKVICIDYKSYPRKSENELKEIKNTGKKYQLITALLTFEYNYNMETKLVVNVDLGTSGYPNISYYKPTSIGITYYKKALFTAYKHLLENTYPTKFNERYCVNFCDFKLLCPDEKMKYWRDYYYITII